MPPARRAVILGGILLFIITACNFPLLPHPGGSTGPADPAAEETLAALWFSDSTPPPLQETAGPLHGLATLAPGSPTSSPPAGMLTYTIQPGDTLDALAKRFRTEPESIRAAFPLPAQGFLPAGETILLPSPQNSPQDNLQDSPGSSAALLPDSEVIFSPSAAGLDTAAYIRSAGGYLDRYAEQVGDERLSGAEIVNRVALETSTNPALLLGILEYRSGWVTSFPSAAAEDKFPIGFKVPSYQGLYHELLLVTRFLTVGYYGWRSGSLTRLTLADGSTVSIAPTLNAGSVALQSLFAVLYNQNAWNAALYGPGNFPSAYTALFGDPWRRAAVVEPLFPPGLQPPALELPFLPGPHWSLTGGPHAAWGVGSPPGALDFAPVTGQKGCEISTAWATAAAGGLVVRSDNGAVVIDLDGDGREQTGWNLLYLHIAREGRVPAGAWVQTDDRIGHPSCEGGNATGTHVHFSRKYNGEWIAADGPLPLVLSGWTAYPGERSYLGGLTKDGRVVTAKSDGSGASSIVR